MIRVLLNGAAGKMGQAMGCGILRDPELELAAAVDVSGGGRDFGQLARGETCGVRIGGDLEQALNESRPDVMLDFTVPETVRAGVAAALDRGVACVVGTTGLDDAALRELDARARARDTGVIVAPNFALTAVLMARFAAQAARYFPDYELVEAHHDRKPDAPSGTALALLRTMDAARAPKTQERPDSGETVPGCRGGAWQGARVHSLRLPGVLARHEIIFGGPGQLLTIRQEATNRECFWPGVRLALLRVGGIRGLVSGLNELI